MKRILLLLCVLATPLLMQAQGPGRPHGGIPDDVYYLMPSFADGYVYFRGQMPAQGKLNICALDHSLRFIAEDGQELEASNPESVIKVMIDTVFFLHCQDLFYRMYPVSADMGVALERKVHIIRGAKEGAYGASTQTSSIREYSTYISEGYSYDLKDGKDVPFEVNENVCIYKGDTVFPFNKRNLRKLFPAKKAEIDAWFKAGHSLPRNVEGARELLRYFNQ